ncbi:hypothetical protein N340_13347, partial [Tauraco erythrolophus]
DQWPLSQEKLTALHLLVKEQLAAGHIEASHSPWNTPVFAIKKKSGKWCLLHDLRKVNEMMATMGTLQPGLPSPTVIPMQWGIVVMDLKDCFFTIPLANQDMEKFAFTVPSVNNSEPAKRYHWKVLPQGMKNSPTVCQWFVAKASSRVQAAFPSGYCYRYMDAILLAAPSQVMLAEMEAEAQKSLQYHGLVIAPEKVQRQQPWLYLGMKVLDQTVMPQPIRLQIHIKTLNDVQKLAGMINWVRPYLGLTCSKLQLLLELLKEDSDI